MDPYHTAQDLADAALHPTPRAIYYQHKQWRKQNLGGRSLESSWETLNHKLPTSIQDGHYVYMCIEPFAIAIITPIMQRVHRLPSSIYFIDITASCDAENHVITFLLTPTMCGGVPLGVLITSSISEEACTAGFYLINDFVW